MLNQPTVATVDWPADRCRHFALGTEAPPRDPPQGPRVARLRPGVDATDTAAMAELRGQGLTARDLARLLDTPRATMARRLIRLRELGLVRSDLEGLWQIAL